MMATMTSSDCYAEARLKATIITCQRKLGRFLQRIAEKESYAAVSYTHLSLVIACSSALSGKSLCVSRSSCTAKSVLMVRCDACLPLSVFLIVASDKLASWASLARESSAAQRRTFRSLPNAIHSLIGGLLFRFTGFRSITAVSLLPSSAPSANLSHVLPIASGRTSARFSRRASGFRSPSVSSPIPMRGMPSLSCDLTHFLWR